ncbi:hypothetical protein LTR17_018059 [Elasticomyces elasticus]|nr:hypothetical protein LTR17_018059 [Elasticomyces elasticus]
MAVPPWRKAATEDAMRVLRPQYFARARVYSKSYIVNVVKRDVGYDEPASRSERTVNWDRARDRPDRNTRNQQQQHGYERRGSHKRHYNDYHDDHRRWDNRNRDRRSDYYVQHHEREQRPRSGTGNEAQSHHQDSPPYRSGRLANPTLQLTRVNGITRPIIEPFFGSSPEDYDEREASSNAKHRYGNDLEKSTILTSFDLPSGCDGERRTDPVRQRHESGSVTKDPILPLFSSPPNAGRDYRVALEQQANGIEAPCTKVAATGLTYQGGRRCD